jgi:hypothetical protein
VRNPTYEQAIAKQGLEWKYEECILIEDIDRDKGLQNQARLEQPLDNDLVDVYAEAKKAGHDFPPPVLWRPGRGRWVPVDGNQRLAADVKVGAKHTDAYVILCTDQQVIDRLCWTFNNLVNGKRLTTAEAMEHAVTFVRKYGVEAPVAAREWGINRVTLYTALRVREIADVLDKHKVKRTASLTDDKLRCLSPLLAVGEDVLVKAAESVAQSGADKETIGKLTKDVSRARSVPEKLKVVEDFRQSEDFRVKRAETKGGTLKTVRTLPRDRLAGLLVQIQRLLEDYPEKAALVPAGSKFKTVREVALDVTDRLTILFGLGARPDKEQVS